MSRRTKSVDRFRLLLIIALLTVVALGSFWVQEVMRRSVSDAPTEIGSDEPDYTIEKFVYVKMSPSGHPRYNVSGAKLTHFPKSDSYEVAQPVLDSRNNPASPLTVRALRAVVDHDASNIHMIDKVQIDRPASASAEHFQLQSDYLLVLPDDDVIRTDKPVEMRLGRSVMTGIGASLNNATREFQVSKQTRVTYQSTAPAK